MPFEGYRKACLTMPLLLGLAACATPVPPAGAGVAVPGSWAETQAPPADLDVAQYWTMLGDPLLTEFVEQAVAENLDIAQSAARLDQARAQLRAARAGYAPQINASGGVQRDVGDFASKDFNFSVGADASWEADLFGRISGNVAASRADLEAAGYSLADIQRLIVGQVALGTIQARATALQLAIARDTLNYQDDNLQIARWRNQAGLVSSLDVEQARSQRAATAATIPQLESSLAARANAISTLIGEPPGRVLTLLQGSDFVPEPPALEGFAAPADVLRRRPDVRGAEASLVAASARVGVAQAQLLPLVRLTGNIGTGATSVGSLFDIITGGIVASIGQLIFDGGRTQAQIDSAKAAAEGALAAWRQSILGALEDVETSAVDLRAARERVAIQGEGRDAAANAALLARSQYQAGLTDFRTLLSAENQLLAARNAEIGAKADLAGAFVRLTQALGGGWTPAAYPAISDRETDQ
ncbi:efflux transporter outer membrane subunit [Croceibacterium aestuarii]|uniref:efflux transporter outer membrane subunit n=1 Tax=Croceibacterium aestuarii TaxID=3064139 RepID=UPI00272EBF75|nr:efflux transporter outer membrane subunit [Croceibacterium sp. D39]